MGKKPHPDENRPAHMKGHAPTEDVKSTCGACLRRDHKSCNGWSTRGKVKCLCAWLKHTD